MKLTFFAIITVMFCSPALAGEECLDLSFKEPRGEVCITGSRAEYRLRMKQPKRKPVEIRVKLEEGERVDLEGFGACDLAREVLVWLPITRQSEGHTLMFVYRIRPARWKQLPVRWTCRRRCTLQHVSYQTTISGGPPDTRIFYETEIDGQHLKSTYSWDGRRLKPIEIEEPRSRDALTRGYPEPELVPVCHRTPQVREAIEKRTKLPCEKIDIDQLAKIKRLSLDRRDLQGLKSGDFSGLSGLTSLDMMHNPLKELPPGVFDGLFKLRSLNFQGCELSTVPAGIFKHLGSLKDLYLNHNQLEKLPAGAFEGLNSLTFLSLNHNRLESLPPGIFKPLPEKCNVYLSNNPKLNKNR